MSSSAKSKNHDALLTPEGKLRHENNFLKERIKNLEIFKKNFFILQNDLIDARECLAIHEETSSFAEIKERMIKSHEAPIDEIEISQTDDILDFFHDSITANNYQDLVMAIFQSLSDLDLNIGIQIHNNNKENINYSLKETDKKELTNIINQHKDKGEVIENNGFIIINHKFLSLIATNLPESNKSKNKQIKEFIKIIALGANTRIDTLETKIDLRQLKDNIYKIFKKTNASFSTIQDNMDSQAITVSNLFLSFENNILSTLDRTSLSKAHADLIKLIVTDTKSELNLSLTSFLTMDDHFINVMKKLEDAYAPKENSI